MPLESIRDSHLPFLPSLPPPPSFPTSSMLPERSDPDPTLPGAGSRGEGGVTKMPGITMPRIGVTLPFPHCFPVILIELLIGLSIGDRWPGWSRSRSGRTKAAPAVEEIGKRYIRKLGKSASSRMGRGPEPGAPSPPTSHPIFFFLGFYFPGAGFSPKRAVPAGSPRIFNVSF